MVPNLVKTSAEVWKRVMMRQTDMNVCIFNYHPSTTAPSPALEFTHFLSNGYRYHFPWRWREMKPTSWGKECVDLYLHSPIRLHGVLQYMVHPSLGCYKMEGGRHADVRLHLLRQLFNGAVLSAKVIWRLTRKQFREDAKEVNSTKRHNEDHWLLRWDAVVTGTSLTPFRREYSACIWAKFIVSLLYPEEGGSRILRNTDYNLTHYKPSHSRRTVSLIHGPS
jgi:hypothetical protein